MKYQQYFDLLNKEKNGLFKNFRIISTFDHCVKLFDLNKIELDIFVDKDFNKLFIHDKNIILIVSNFNSDDFKIKVYKISQITELNYEYFVGDDIMLGISFVIENNKYSHGFINEYFEYGSNFPKIF